MNVMLATLLQRGNSEVKSTPLESDVDETQGSDDFNALMAKLESAEEKRQQGKLDEQFEEEKTDTKQALAAVSTASVSGETSEQSAAHPEQVRVTTEHTDATAATEEVSTSSDKTVLSETISQGKEVNASAAGPLLSQDTKAPRVSDKVVLNETSSQGKDASTLKDNDLLSQITAAKQQSTTLKATPKEVSTAVRTALQSNGSQSQVTDDEAVTLPRELKLQSTEQQLQAGKQQVISDAMTQEAEGKVEKAFSAAGDIDAGSTAQEQSKPTKEQLQGLQKIIDEAKSKATEQPRTETSKPTTKEQLLALQKLIDEAKSKVTDQPRSEAPKPTTKEQLEAQNGTGKLPPVTAEGEVTKVPSSDKEDTALKGQEQTIIHFRNKADVGPISGQLQGSAKHTHSTDKVTSVIGLAEDNKSAAKVTNVLNSLNPVQQKELQAVLNGDVDIYDASPSVQKAIAQLLANKNMAAAKVANEPVKAVQPDPLTVSSESKKDTDMASVTTPQELKKAENAGEYISPVKQLKQDKVVTNERVYQGEPEQTKLNEKAQAEKQVSEKLSEKLSDKELNTINTQENTSAKENSKAERAPFTNIFSTTRAESTPNATSNTEPTSLNQTMKEVQQLQQSQNSSSSSATQTKPAVDANLQQAINIARHDAAKELNQRVGMMLNLNNKQAEIRLDPPELGALQIRIKSDAEQAQVNFVVQNQQAKEMLEQSLPRLREMLAEQGIELGESHISHGQSEGQDGESDGQGQFGSGAHGNDDEQVVASGSQQGQQRNSDSAIDYYA